jgi:hypothetical protein
MLLSQCTVYAGTQIMIYWWYFYLSNNCTDNIDAYCIKIFVNIAPNNLNSIILLFDMKKKDVGIDLVE